MGTMKYFLLSLLSAFLLVGCSTDGSDTESPTAGVYIGRSGSIVPDYNMMYARIWVTRNSANFQQTKNRIYKLLKIK